MQGVLVISRPEAVRFIKTFHKLSLLVGETFDGVRAPRRRRRRSTKARAKPVAAKPKPAPKAKGKRTLVNAPDNEA